MTVKIHGRTVDGVAVVKLKLGRSWGGSWGRIELADGRSKGFATSVGGEVAVYDWMAEAFDREEGR